MADENANQFNNLKIKSNFEKWRIKQKLAAHFSN